MRTDGGKITRQNHCRSFQLNKKIYQTAYNKKISSTTLIQTIQRNIQQIHRNIQTIIELQIKYYISERLERKETDVQNLMQVRKG